MKTGYIRIIGGKLIFEYYKLLEPDSYIADDYCLPEYKWKQQMKEYEASKRTVEVSNDYSIHRFGNAVHLSFKDESGKLIDLITNIPDNQPCKAEVNGKAKIIELIK